MCVQLHDRTYLCIYMVILLCAYLWSHLCVRLHGHTCVCKFLVVPVHATVWSYLCVEIYGHTYVYACGCAIRLNSDWKFLPGACISCSSGSQIIQCIFFACMNFHTSQISPCVSVSSFEVL